MTCANCSRTLVPQRTWAKHGPEHRKMLYRTHAREHSKGLCFSCYQAAYRRRGGPPAEQIGYIGGWVRAGRILRPAPDGPSLEFYGEAS